MSRILIVSKTKMGKKGICVGGVTIPELKSVRLMQADGSYHDHTTKFNVGELWDIEYSIPDKIIAPHVENVLIVSQNFLRKYSSITDIIDSDKLEGITYTGSPANLFDDKLAWTGSDHGYIAKRNGVPSHSTGFWVTDKDLVLEGNYYVYKKKKNGVQIQFGFKYVGVEQPIDLIPAGTKIRVSLAKWWAPDDVPEMELRCYLQLSGWYS